MNTVCDLPLLLAAGLCNGGRVLQDACAAAVPFRAGCGALSLSAEVGWLGSAGASSFVSGRRWGAPCGSGSGSVLTCAALAAGSGVSLRTAADMVRRHEGVEARAGFYGGGARGALTGVAAVECWNLADKTLERRDAGRGSFG